MNKKRHFGLWLVIISIVAGAIATSLQLYRECLLGFVDFTLFNLICRFLVFSGITLVALLLLIFPLKLCRWLFSWRILKRCLLALGFFLALIPLFYAVEDWRGKRAWEKYKHEWEAKGEKFDFASFIPPPVPDEQNFALTSIMASSYSRVLDKYGHRIKPANTNVVNRLKLELYRQNFYFQATTNMQLNG